MGCWDGTAPPWDTGDQNCWDASSDCWLSDLIISNSTDVGNIGSTTDTLVCNSDAVSEYPNVAHVYGSIYVVCWAVSDTDGYICTIEISDSGIIAIADGPVHFESTACTRPRIIKVADNMFAYCYRYNLGWGIIRSIQINDDGTIVTPHVDFLVFEGDECYGPEICEVTSNVFAIVYKSESGAYGLGKIVTVRISDLGAISDLVLDSWVMAPIHFNGPDILKVGTNMFAIFYTDPFGDGCVMTLEISNAGVITESVVDYLKFDAASASWIFAVHFIGNFYALVYMRAGGEGEISTIEIASDGQIGAAPISQIEYTEYGHAPSIVSITSNTMIIAHEASPTTGGAYTFCCSALGSITDAPKDTFALDGDCIRTPWVFHVAGSIYAVAYEDLNHYISIKTFNVTIPIWKRIQLGNDGRGPCEGQDYNCWS